MKKPADFFRLICQHRRLSFLTTSRPVKEKKKTPPVISSLPSFPRRTRPQRRCGGVRVCAAAPSAPPPLPATGNITPPPDFLSPSPPSPPRTHPLLLVRDPSATAAGGHLCFFTTTSGSCPPAGPSSNLPSAPVPPLPSKVWAHYF